MQFLRCLLLGLACGIVARAEAQSTTPSRHWSFQPLRRVQVPEVRTPSWCRTPLDRFVLSRLESAGLRPAPPADRLTLIRRATFDLTGLPPTPFEIGAFLADPSPSAFARVIDRLLESPRYGEKWGRHWLDVARYADSNGLDENIAHGNAWRYRDYVVHAFNTDMPFDRFLIEQIAGDLLPTDTPSQRRAQLVATGFLALGPKVLAEVDETKMEMDIIDEQLDTLGRATMGLTLGCARCHDHKFDPFTTEDYYALAGIFKSTRTMEHFKKIARWWEHSLATPEEQAAHAAHLKRVQAQKDAIAAAVARAKAQLQATGAPVPTKPAELEAAFPATTRGELQRMRDELAAVEKATPELPGAIGVAERDVADLRVHVRGSHLSLGSVVPRRFPVTLAGRQQPAFGTEHSGRLRLAHWLVDPEHPLTTRVLANRLWRWHFGRGLVASTDNFGILGERPSHPELLDWLAREIAGRGWSLKSMHRLIMLSATYQMQSGGGAPTDTRDLENRLWSRFLPRRLQAEEIRDALLFVSGRLELVMGGSLLHVKNREFFFDHTSKDTTKYDSVRRTLYLPIVRNHLYDVLQLFDATDAAVSESNRATTTVPTQALFFLNSGLMTEAARALAGQLVASVDDESLRFRTLYRQVYGRDPSAAERERARVLLTRFRSHLAASSTADRTDTDRAAWAALAQTLLAANEFVVVR